MFADIFKGIFDTDMTSVIAPSDFLLCVGSSLVIGLILAGFYMYRTRYTKSFVATLALLPAVVCVVIMMVNGNEGPVLQWPGRSAWYVSVPHLALRKRLERSSWPWVQV